MWGQKAEAARGGGGSPHGEEVVCIEENAHCRRAALRVGGNQRTAPTPHGGQPLLHSRQRRATSQRRLGRSPHLYQLPAGRAAYQHSSTVMESPGMQPFQLRFLQGGQPARATHTHCRAITLGCMLRVTVLLCCAWGCRNLSIFGCMLQLAGRRWASRSGIDCPAAAALLERRALPSFRLSIGAANPHGQQWHAEAASNGQGLGCNGLCTEDRAAPTSRSAASSSCVTLLTMDSRSKWRLPVFIILKGLAQECGPSARLHTRGQVPPRRYRPLLVGVCGGGRCLHIRTALRPRTCCAGCRRSAGALTSFLRYPVAWASKQHKSAEPDFLQRCSFATKSKLVDKFRSVSARLACPLAVAPGLLLRARLAANTGPEVQAQVSKPFGRCN